MARLMRLRYQRGCVSRSCSRRRPRLVIERAGTDRPAMWPDQLVQERAAQAAGRSVADRSH